MKYTKAERHEIYKKALLSAIEIGSGCCLCFRISSVSGSYPDIDTFPEFFMFKPDRIKEDAVWFGDDSGFEIRKTVLEFCIEMTKPTRK